MNGLTRKQVDQLLRPIAPERVLKDRDGLSHVSQQDIRAHLNRIFGFTGWSTEIVELKCVRDTDKVVPPKNGKPERTVPAVTYLCRLRLTIGEGNPFNSGRACSYEDVGTGTSPNLPDYGDAHDFAAKNAVSYALKRCATNLGDQFGLSLYNKGQTSALVKGTLVMPEGQEHVGDVQAGVPQQVDMGDERPADEPEPHAPPANGHSEDPVKKVKVRVWLAARKRGLTTGDDVATDYAATHDGELLDNATVDQLTAYAELLEKGVVA